MSKRNENRQGYKKTKVGWIPEEWEFRKIGEIAETSSGTTPSRRKQKEYFEKGSYKWVKTMDLNNSSILSTNEQITDEALSDTTCKLFPINTVFVAMYGGFNQIGRTGVLRVPAACNQALTAILPSERFFSDFLLLFFNFRVGYWKAIAASSRKDPNITRKDIVYFPIPLPPLPEQKKIAEILSAWDRTIEQMGKLIDAKQKLKIALMQQLLTGKKRFKEFEHEIHEKKKGDLPEGWKQIKLSSIFKPVRRKNSEGCKRVLTASGEHGLIDQRDFFNRSIAGENLQTYYLLKKGEFAYNRSSMNGYPYGAIKRLEDYTEGVLSTLYICFAKKNDDLCPEFYAYYFESGLLNHDLYGIVHVGARAHGLLNVSVSDFMNINIPYTTMKEQRRIATVLSTCDKEIELLKKKMEKLKQQKKGLMQKLLTGEIRTMISE